MTSRHRNAEASDYQACQALFGDLRKRHRWDGWFPRTVFDDYVGKTKNETRYIQELFFDNQDNLVGYVRAAHLKDKSQTTVYETLVDPDDILTMKKLLDFVAEEAAVFGTPRVVAKYTDHPQTENVIGAICGFGLHHREEPIAEKLKPGSARKAVLVFTRELAAGAAPHIPKKHPNYRIVD